MKKIVIVEDDELVANIYRNKLLVEGYLVEVALDGEKGLELITRWQPDLVVLDLMVPKISGVELLGKIRGHPGLQALPVVVFSSSYLTSAIEKAWQAGATMCISKSICTPRQMLDMVRKLIYPPPPAAGAQSLPASDSAPAAEAHTPAESAAEARTQAGLHQDFVDSLPAILNNLRAAFQPLGRTTDETVRLKQLEELLREVRDLTGRSGITGMLQISQMSDALEALLKELCDKPKGINASTLRTVALTIDFLGLLFKRSRLPEAQASSGLAQSSILVVDDEVLSRRAISHALEKAGLASVCLGDPLVALEQLKTKSFDLIFLDVDMPGMTGFELCAKLRTLPLHKKTPVVFVTGLTDFESRCNSTMCGGNDLIAKPFLFMELAVKAVIHVMRARLDTAE